jgi:hypothetical protein
MKTVGYFDGTDSALLTKVAAHGFYTLPLGNQWDGHGKIATHLEPGEVDLIIAYLHKLLPPRGEEPGPVPSPVYLLYRAKTYNIPILVIVDKSHHRRAKDVLGEAAEFVEFVAPEELDGKVCEILGL